MRVNERVIRLRVRVSVRVQVWVRDKDRARLGFRVMVTVPLLALSAATPVGRHAARRGASPGTEVFRFSLQAGVE